MKLTKNDRGFTLIEMVIVLLIISVLLLVAVPNMVTNSSVAHSTGCDATIDLLQAQLGAYEIETGEEVSSLDDLVDGDYVDRTTCPDGTPLTISNGSIERDE
ncbi:competence type IV pilus major pilin ComGC [Salsuginibacillus kocurii]|uniref:competence type IV pilus major pilin ComGC n=1 Tax=Salsuginibacillus kocurii TaxID=427078 RepID=UPI0003727515|nr:competence type IV pilus major pilin ComGC [Salsuginibacillus kocurii]